MCAMQETINKQQRENNRRKRLEEDAEDVKRREEKNGKFVDPLYIKHPKMVGEDVYKTRSTHDMGSFRLKINKINFRVISDVKLFMNVFN